MLYRFYFPFCLHPLISCRKCAHAALKVASARERGQCELGVQENTSPAEISAGNACKKAKKYSSVILVKKLNYLS